MGTSLHLFGYRVEDITLGRLVADRAAQRGNHIALHNLADGRRFTYGELDLISNRIANGLARKGIGKGMHVAIVMDNCPELMFTYFALAKLGAVSVPLNPSARGQLLVRYLDHSEAMAVIVEQNYAGRVAEAAVQLPAIKHFILHRPANEAPIAEKLPLPAEPFAALYDESDAAPDVEVRFSDRGMLAYTSGTTGPSKAVDLAQASMVMFGMTTAESHGYRFSDIVYVCLPLYHANALLCASFGAMVAGGTIAVARRFSVSNYWEDIRVSGATLTNMLGSISNLLWSLPPSDRDNEHSLRQVNMVPVAPFALEFERRFATRIVSSYGISDYAIATAYTFLDPVSKLGSSGRSRPGMELRIVDENDAELPSGEVGEIVLRSHNRWGTAQGYFRNAEATVASLRNHWFHTGDRGWLDADGYLFFADRKKDSIRRRGENISAFEVESILLRHPAIVDVAAYPVNSEMSEDEVAVSVVLRAGQALDAMGLIGFCAEQMAHYMVPRFVQFLPELPRTATEKIEKTILRRDAEADLSKLWDREKSGFVLRR